MTDKEKDLFSDLLFHAMMGMEEKRNSHDDDIIKEHLHYKGQEAEKRMSEIDGKKALITASMIEDTDKHSNIGVAINGGGKDIIMAGVAVINAILKAFDNDMILRTVTIDVFLKTIRDAVDEYAKETLLKEGGDLDA